MGILETQAQIDLLNEFIDRFKAGITRNRGFGNTENYTTPEVELLIGNLIQRRDILVEQLKEIPEDLISIKLEAANPIDYYTAFTGDWQSLSSELNMFLLKELKEIGDIKDIGRTIVEFFQKKAIQNINWELLKEAFDKETQWKVEHGEIKISDLVMLCTQKDFIFNWFKEKLK